MFATYLAGRTQKTDINGRLSDELNLDISFLQGSILGPIISCAISFIIKAKKNILTCWGFSLTNNCLLIPISPNSVLRSQNHCSSKAGLKTSSIESPSNS
jgi:hypothetical protein